ncbi:hypothetical protein BgAZ_401420 [Babesia gibsoni]|uniref:Uncharacterized protein n=1 Tax=Babesia gibsoni TaxID=33632 RepID=A0AAD8PDC0_BABGI|nr:hypothetical protein BgAZ_401420 [Babesia gibsoni]
MKSAILSTIVGLSCCIRLVEAYNTVAGFGSSKTISSHIGKTHEALKYSNSTADVDSFDDNIVDFFKAILREEESTASMKEPLKFFYGKKGATEENSDSGIDDFTNTVAECEVAEEVKGRRIHKTLYIKLADAEDLLKRFEEAKLARNGQSGTSNALDKGEPEITCKAVVINDESRKCKSCMYVEELSKKNHVRFGTIRQSTILSCVNGYDDVLDPRNQKKPWFIYSTAAYHPICTV